MIWLPSWPGTFRFIAVCNSAVWWDRYSRDHRTDGTMRKILLSWLSLRKMVRCCDTSRHNVSIFRFQQSGCAFFVFVFLFVFVFCFLFCFIALCVRVLLLRFESPSGFCSLLPACWSYLSLSPSLCMPLDDVSTACWWRLQDLLAVSLAAATTRADCGCVSSFETVTMPVHTFYNSSNLDIHFSACLLLFFVCCDFLPSITHFAFSLFDRSRCIFLHKQQQQQELIINGCFAFADCK